MNKLIYKDGIVDWNATSKYSKLDKDFILNNITNLNTYYVIISQDVDDEIISKFTYKLSDKEKQNDVILNAYNGVINTIGVFSNLKKWDKFYNNVDLSYEFIKLVGSYVTTSYKDNSFTLRSITHTDFGLLLNESGLFKKQFSFINIDLIKENKDLFNDFFKYILSFTDYFIIIKDILPLFEFDIINEELLNEIINKFDLDKHHFSKLSENYYLSEEFIEKYKDVLDWNYITSFNNFIYINDDFIEKYESYINWYILSSHYPINDKFIEKYCNKIDWNLISRNSFISINVIDKYKDKLNWNYLTQFYDSKILVEKFPDYIDIRTFINIVTSIELFNKMKYRMDWEYALFNCPLIAKEQFMVDNFQYLINECNLSVDLLLKTKLLPINLIEDNIKLFNINNIFQYTSDLDINFIKKYVNKENVNIIIKNHFVDEEFLEQNINYLDWSLLPLYQKLSENFIQKYNDKLNHKSIILFQNDIFDKKRNSETFRKFL